MEKGNLDQIEMSDYHDQDSSELGEKIPSRWEIMSRNANIRWRYGNPALGENIKTGYPNNLHGFTGWYALSCEVDHKLDESSTSKLFIE
jgi:hypothetical protein